MSDILPEEVIDDYLVPGILRVHSDSSITQHGLRTGISDDDLLKVCYLAI